MFRGLRHTLYLFLQIGILASAAIALLVQPAAWPAVLICSAGASVMAYACVRIARGYLRTTLGGLRRVADEIGAGRRSELLEAHPGDDLYKLVGAINRLVARLAAASEEGRKLQEQLRRSERLAYLGELAARVAHEVNNPLDGVQNCVRILRRNLEGAGESTEPAARPPPDPARTRQMLDLIESGLARIESIVRRLLALARENVIRPVAARVSEIVGSAVASLEEKLAARGVRIRRTDAEDDDAALVDRLLLEHVFTNLLVNAADSMPSGGEVEICVRRERGDDPGRDEQSAGMICVDFADRGMGVSPEDLPHIFEPFFTTKTDGKGTGLGLPIAARIMDAHHGGIRAVAREGGGTVFTVRLPALTAGAPRRSAAPAPAASAVSS